MTTTSNKIDVPSLLGVALIAFWVLALVVGIGTPRGWISDSRGIPIEGDYNGLYTAGTLALGGEPAAAYKFERHKQAQHDLVANPKGNFYPWPYPPSFLFAAAAMALLPYYVSMLTWTLATFAAFAAALMRITTTQRGLLLMLAAPAAWLNLYVGQNGALTASLIGFGLALLPEQPVLAGVCFGVLSIKPHLALLIPIALAAGGHWRTFGAAAVTAIGIAIVTTAVFGTEPWLAMPDQLQRVTAIFKSTTMPEKIQSVFGFARAVSLSVETALALQIACATLLAAGIAWLWRRRDIDIDIDLKCAALAAAITLTSPYQFVYDLVILTIAQAFLLRHATRAGTSYVEIAGLIAANVLVLLFAATAVPLGVWGCVIVLALVARRALAAIATSKTTAPTIDTRSTVTI